MKVITRVTSLSTESVGTNAHYNPTPFQQPSLTPVYAERLYFGSLFILGHFCVTLIATITHKNCETALLSLFNAIPISRLMHGAEKSSMKSFKNIMQPLHSKS